MEIMLLGIYSFFVWLIFIKLKLLPWTTPWKVASRSSRSWPSPSLLLLLNIFAPTTTDVRVVKYVVPIVSQVRGRVIEVPVENNRPVKKGDVLFRIDPTPYQNEVNSLEAQAGVRRGQGRRRSAAARRGAGEAGRRAVERARSCSEQLNAGQRAGRGAHGVARPGAQARRAEHRARRPPAPATGSTSSRRRRTSTS